MKESHCYNMHGDVSICFILAHLFSFSMSIKGFFCIRIQRAPLYFNDQIKSSGWFAVLCILQGVWHLHRSLGPNVNVLIVSYASNQHRALCCKVIWRATEASRSGGYLHKSVVVEELLMSLSLCCGPNNLFTLLYSLMCLSYNIFFQGNILYQFPSLQRTAAPQRSGRKEYVGKRWTDWVGQVERFLQEKKWQFRYHFCLGCWWFEFVTYGFNFNFANIGFTFQ